MGMMTIFRFISGIITKKPHFHVHLACHIVLVLLEQLLGEDGQLGV